MTTAQASTIFGPLFSDAEVTQVWSDAACVRALVEVEIALARAEATLGLIPSSAAERIGQTRADEIDVGALARGTVRSGFPVIALADELRRLAGADAAPYVHWGATTQDIMDTACVLQIRSTGKLFKIRLAEIARHLTDLCARHRATVMAGRTHGQQALPISFGLKVAGWLAPLVRHAERLDEMSPRLLVVEFGGAAGTLAALGDQGLAVAQALAVQLDLNAPLMPWHAQRDAFAEFAGWLSLVTGSLGKMAQDVILLAQTEVGEVTESSEAGRGSSSTMPQKNNPIISELILAAARANASLLSAMHHGMIQEHERGTHGWQVEWLSLPQMAGLTGGALRHAIDLSKNLQVDVVAMRANLVRANDVTLAEAAVFALAKAMPRTAADELVKEACGIAATEKKPLIDTVRELAGNTVPDGTIDWQALAGPENYLGESEKIIDAVLREARKLDLLSGPLP